MEDILYTLPSADATWTYCYVISVPAHSEECLYDVTLTDPSPIGGTGGPRNVTGVGETLCKGQTMYLPGVNRVGVVSQERPFDATVQGYDYYSDKVVTERNIASVRPPLSPTDTPTSSPPSSCPLVKLDFTDLPNPMARYYGQNSTFRAGDYLFDQLWWTHGVKVSVSSTGATTGGIFIPKFTRGRGWANSNSSHNFYYRSSGGAIRLFDTMRPSGSSDSRYNQPLCAIGEGNPDLGAPNVNCYRVGPGKYPSSRANPV